MTVLELIDKLKDMPQDAEVFYGQDERCRDNRFPDLPVFMLFSFDPIYYPKVVSIGNCSPRPGTEQENVVVFEYD